MVAKRNFDQQMSQNTSGAVSAVNMRMAEREVGKLIDNIAKVPKTPTKTSVPQENMNAVNRVAQTPTAPIVVNQNSTVDTRPITAGATNPYTGLTQTQGEAEFNARQRAFDQANPVGTQMQDIVRPTQEQVQVVEQQGQQLRSEFPQPVQAPQANIQMAGGRGNAMYTPTTENVREQRYGTMQNAPVDATEQQMREIARNNARTASGQQMLTNLNEGFKNAPQLFADRDTFNKAYGYDTKDQSERQVLDAFWQSKQNMGEDEYYNMIASGQTVYNQSSPAYQAAKKLYDSTKTYGSMSPSELANRMNTDIALQGKTMQGLERQNPELVRQARAIQEINKQNFNEIRQADGSTIVVDDRNRGNMTDIAISSVMQPFFDVINGKSPDLATEMAAAIQQDEALTADRLKARELQENLNSNEDAIEALDDDLYEIMKGRSISESVARSLIAKSKDDLIKERNGYLREYETVAGAINDRTQQITTQYEARMAQQQQKFDAIRYVTGVMQQEQARQDGLNEAQTQRDFEMQRYQQEIDRENEKLMGLNSSNPAIQQASLMQMVASEVATAQEAGIPIVRSIPQIVQDIQALAQSQGISVAEAYQQNFQVPLQSKPEYQAVQQARLMSNFPQTASASPYKVSNGVIYNEQTGQYQMLPNAKGSSTAIPNSDGNITNDNIASFLGGRESENYMGNDGIDYAVPIGSPNKAVVNGTVEEVGEQPGKSGFYVKIKGEDGNTYIHEHLAGMSLLTKGATVSLGQEIGKVGNSGNVMTQGRTPTQAERDAGAGSHVSIIIRKPNGAEVPVAEQKEMIRKNMRLALGRQGIITGGITKSIFGGNASDKDAARIEQSFQSYIDAGYTPEQAIRDIRMRSAGYNVSSENSEVGDKLYNKLLAMTAQDEKMQPDAIAALAPSIARMINDGDIGSAIDLIEGGYDGRVKENENKVSTMRKMDQQIDFLIDGLVDAEGIGFVSGSITDLLTKIEDNPKYLPLKATLEDLQNGTRNSLLGAAVTDSEMRRAETTLGLNFQSLTAENLISALDTMRNNALSRVNSVRRGYGLPRLSSDNLTNPGLLEAQYLDTDKTYVKNNLMRQINSGQITRANAIDWLERNGYRPQDFVLQNPTLGQVQSDLSVLNPTSSLMR